MQNAVQPKLIPMGERKLMPMGNGGLVMTIPKVWAGIFQLKAGDKVELEIVEGALHIRPKAARATQEDSIDDKQP